MAYAAASPQGEAFQLALDATGLPPLPSGLQAASAFHRFATLQEGIAQVQVRIALEQAALGAGKNLRLLALDPKGAWREVEGAVRDGAHLVAQVGQLSALVAVIGEADDEDALAGARATALAAQAHGQNAPISAAAGRPPVSEVSTPVGQTAVFLAPGSLVQLPGDTLVWRFSLPSGVFRVSCGFVGGDTRQCLLGPVIQAWNGANVQLSVRRGTLEEVVALYRLTVTPAAVPPTLGVSPAPVAVAAGAIAEFNAAATGTTPLSWQWLRDGVPIAGANAPTLSLPTTGDDVGRQISISVRVSNAAGSATSQAVSLTVNAVPVVVNAAEGGILPGANGTELYIPPGALVADTAITVTREAVPAGLLPEGYRAVTDIIRIAAPTLVLNQPMQLMVPVPEVQAGETLIFIPVTGLTQQARRALSAKPASTAATLTVNTAGACANLQNASQSGLLPRAIAGPVAMVAAVVDTSLCSSLEPRVLSLTAPSITTAECKIDDDFKVGSGDQTLLSRHVDCQLSRAIGEKVQVDYKRRKPSVAGGTPGSWEVMSSPQFTNTEEQRSVDRYTGGLLETRISIYGPGNSLTKQVSVRARFATSALAPAQPSEFPPVTSIKARFVPICGNPDACEGALQPVEVTIPLGSSGWSAPASTTVTFRDPGPGNSLSTTLDFSRIEYAAGSNSYSVAYQGPVDPGGRRVWSSNIQTSPKLTCDNGLAKRNTAGCVFEDAAAVFAIDHRGREAKRHIADAMRLPELLDLGRFSAAEGSRAVASSEALGKSLQRTRDAVRARQNREVTKTKCSDLSAGAPFDTPTDADGDLPDSGLPLPQQNRDCDEYPPASTINGGRFNELSVRRIDASDNRSAGGQLGAFYAKERIKDGSNFWVKTD